MRGAAGRRRYFQARTVGELGVRLGELPQAAGDAGAAGEWGSSGYGAGQRYGRDVRDAGGAAGQSLAGVSDDYRGVRQGLLVLRGAVHAGAGAQPVERGDFARSAGIGWGRVHGSATAGADGEFVRGSHGREDEIFGAATGGGGGAGNPARAVYYVASEGFWAGH